MLCYGPLCCGVTREMAAIIGITEQNLSLLKSGKVKRIRFDTLAKICEAMECQHGDIISREADLAAPAED
ncbi:helix-turn-helix domain-containing protein [Cronobacter universalis]